MKEKEKNDSKKNIKLRIAAFIVAFVVAIAAFSIGIVNIGAKREGYNEITTEADDDAVLYANGVSFQYYFSGKSSEIKTAFNELKGLYSNSLKRSYKLLDATTTYDGFTNIAALNENPGSQLEVSDELYDVLTDAYEKTLQREGYNMFAGALYAEWQSILILSEPEEFDPSVNSDEAERISAIAAITSDLSNFSLKVIDEKKHIVEFNVSDEYRRFVEEYEITAPIIDLNMLHDAYELQIVKNELEGYGYTRGYFCTDSGLTVSMSGNEAGDMCLHGNKDGGMQLGTVPVTASLVCSGMRAFPISDDEDLYYSIIDVNGQNKFRHQWFNVSTGDFEDVLMSSYVISTKGRISDACYANLVMNSVNNIDDLEAYADKIGREDMMIVYTLQGASDRRVYVTSSALKSLTTQNGYATSVIE